MTRGSTASAYPYFRRPGHGARTALLLALLAALVGLASQSLAQRDPGRLSAEDRAVLERISAASLRGHLSFLASDTLAGRDTPSPGLDVAAEYIAAQFRRAGLQPGGDDGYFQTANWIHRDAPRERARAELQAGDQAWVLAGAQIGFTPGPRVSANLSQPVHVTFGPENNPTPGAAQIRGNAVVTRFADPPNLTQEEAARHFRIQAERLTRLRAAEPQLIVILQPRPSRFPRFAPGRLLDPENPQRPGPEPSGPRVVALTAPQAAAWLETQPAGNVPLRVALECPAVEDRPVRLRNVVGVLPGSDPALRDTYVLVSAHYDHIGVGPEGEGDRIFNGANDDGSGTVSVIELAAALAARRSAPRRTLVFIAFFGEEKGLLGSRYYGRRPRFPIEKTIAHVNLEQVGRTDDSEGPQVNRASLTGFDFSEVGSLLAEAGRQTGVEVFKHPRNSDAFFGRSDNQALADLGVPAHTLCVAYVFPDYHAVGDHWEKVDYENMARVNRTVALGLLLLGKRRQEPRWNAMNPKADRYRQAWERRRNP